MNAKTIISVLMASALVMSGSQMAFAKVGQESISVHYNGAALFHNSKAELFIQEFPFIYEGSVYLPIREVAEAFDHEAIWDNDTSTIYLNLVGGLDSSNKKITKDYFCGLEYKIPEGWFLDKGNSVFAYRALNFGGGRIVMTFDFGNELGLVSMRDYEKIEKEVKIKVEGGNVFIYFIKPDYFAEQEYLEEFEEFINNIAVKSGVSEYQVTYRDITIILDGKEVKTEKEPFIYNGKVYLPIKEIAKLLSIEIEYHDGTNMIMLQNILSAGGLVFTIPEGCEMIKSVDDYVCYFEKGQTRIEYHRGVSIEDYKNEEAKKRYEEMKLSPFDGLIDYQYAQFDERDYVILDSDMRIYMDDTVICFPKRIITAVNNGVIEAYYFSYGDVDPQELELFEELMFTAVLE